MDDASTDEKIVVEHTKAKGSSDEILLNLELKKVNEQTDCSNSKPDLTNAAIINASNVL